MVQITINGEVSGLEEDDVYRIANELKKITKIHPDANVVDLKIPDEVEFNFDEILQNDVYLSPDVDPLTIPPALLPYIKALGSSNVDLEEAFRRNGYLAPGTDPSTIPPHLLPYVHGVKSGSVDFTEILKNDAYLAPDTDPSTIPPILLPYVKALRPDNIDIEGALKKSGYLAPGTDPSTIPPWILPYVKILNARNEGIRFRDQLPAEFKNIFGVGGEGKKNLASMLFNGGKLSVTSSLDV